jgi:hypothetical protein
MKHGRYGNERLSDRAGNRSFPTTLAATLATTLAGSLVLVACSGDSSEPTMQGSGSNLENAVDLPVRPLDTEAPVNRLDPTVGSDPTPETPVDPTVGQLSGLDSGQFPQDVDGDDRPGMIVTGLDGLDAEDIVSPWLVNAGLFRQASRPDRLGDGYVSLVRYRDDFPISGHINFYFNELDTCYVNDPGAPPGGGNEDDPPPPNISGGTTITINAPSGPWYTFAAQRVDGAVFYDVDDKLPGALPAGATLSIPGADFPTVAAYPLYEPDPVVRLLPNVDELVTTESAYSWIPGNARTYVKLDFLAYDDAGDFQGFLAGCRAEDDGVFQAPEALLDAIDSSPHDIELRYAGGYQRIDYLNGILFHQDNQVAE